MSEDESMSDPGRPGTDDPSSITRRAVLGGIGVGAGTLLMSGGTAVGSSPDTRSNTNGDGTDLRRPFDSRTRWRDAGRLQADFKDLSKWEAVMGSMSADASTSFSGEQSAKLSTAGDRVRIETSIAPTDFSDYDVSIAAKLDESNADVEVRLIDADGAYVAYRSPLRADDGWIQTNMGVSDEYSDVDLADIRTIQVQFAADDGGIEGWTSSAIIANRTEHGVS